MHGNCINRIYRFPGRDPWSLIRCKTGLRQRIIRIISSTLFGASTLCTLCWAMESSPKVDWSEWYEYEPRGFDPHCFLARRVAGVPAVDCQAIFEA